MLKKCGIVALLLLLIAPFTIGTVSAEKSKSGNPYTITPVTDSSGGDISPAWVYDTITQYQTKYYSKYIGSGVYSMEVDLNWGNPSNSLRLTIYTPDGFTLGPFYDDADGVIDGRIHLGLTKNDGSSLAQGTWYDKVYGYSVVGVEDFYI